LNDTRIRKWGCAVASPELQRVMKMLRAGMDATGGTIEELRAATEAMTSALPPPRSITFQRVEAGGVPAEWVSAKDARPDRTVLYFHGGGYVVGSVRTHRALVSRISRAARARVLSLDYRLAPENPFPAAVEDGFAAYCSLLQMGIPPERIAFAGDSAGGGLTVAVLLALRDAGQPLPAAAVCISPWLDLTLSGESVRTLAAVDPMVRAEQLQRMADAYLGGADPRAPLASPLHGEPAGLPPLLIQVGTAEVLLDDSTRFAAAAREACVDVTLEAWEEMVHVWHFFAVILPEGRQAIDRIGEYLRARLP
jgi:epsilon-lactone hydrolase